MAVSLPKTLKLESLTKEQLIALIEYITKQRFPYKITEDDIAYAVWHLESKKNLKEMDDLNNKIQEYAKVRSGAGRAKWMANQMLFDKCMKDGDKISAFCDQYVRKTNG